MNIFITIFILVANVVAILLVYHSFDKKLDNNKRLMYTMISIGVTYIITLIVYFFSSLGIENKTVTDNAKSMITFTFVPVNAIIILPILIRSYNKRKEKQITQEQLNRRTVIMMIIAAILIVVEFFYFKNIQKGIIDIYNEQEAASSNNEVSNAETQNETIQENTQVNNETAQENTQANTEIIENATENVTE